MIAIDFEAVGNWADKGNLPYTNYVDLSSKDEVRNLIAEEVRKINLGIPEVSKVKRFLLLTKDLDADDNEVTRTRKLRRSFIAEKYGPVVEAFYEARICPARISGGLTCRAPSSTAPSCRARFSAGPSPKARVSSGPTLLRRI